MLAPDINDIWPFPPFPPFTSVESLYSVSSASPQSRPFIVFLQSFDLFMSTEWFVVASVATPDSGDSNLPNESGNEVCDIINCVAIYYELGASGNAFLRTEKFRAQVSWKLMSLNESFEGKCRVC